MPFHTKGKRIHSYHGEIGVKGCLCGPEIYMMLPPDLIDIGQGTLPLHERRKIGEAFHVPFKISAVDDGAAHGIAVSAEIFGGGIDDDIGANLEGTAQIGARQRIVHKQRNPVRVGH